MERKTKQGVRDLTMPHWHEHNPWKDDIVYVTLEELAYCADDSYGTLEERKNKIGGRTDRGKLDFYILPQPSGWHDIGIRFDSDGPDYLSPLANKTRTEEILMRKNAEKVIAAFNEGKPAKGDSKATIRTDGTTVWSYAMPIAGFMPDGTLWILDYDNAPTATTRSQVRALETAVRLGSLKCKHEDCKNLLHEPVCLVRK